MRKIRSGRCWLRWGYLGLLQGSWLRSRKRSTGRHLVCLNFLEHCRGELFFLFVGILLLLRGYSGRGTSGEGNSLLLLWSCHRLLGYRGCLNLWLLNWWKLLRLTGLRLDLHPRVSYLVNLEGSALWIASHEILRLLIGGCLRLIIWSASEDESVAVRF